MNAGAPSGQALPGQAPSTPALAYPAAAFTFAVQAAPARHGAGWARLARDAEELGYGALLVPHHEGNGGPVAAVAAAGAATTSLRIGTLMLAVDFYNPAVLTEELRTLEALFGDRLEIGLGAGWLRRDYERTGVRMDAPGDRIRRLGAFVAALEATRTDAGGPGGKLVLGGGGRRMVELAAAHADIVSLGAPMAAGTKEAVLGEAAGLDAFVRRAGWVAEVARRLGRRPRLQCLAYHACVTADARGHVEARLRDGFGLPAGDILASPLALVGTVDELCLELEQHRKRLGISYWVVKAPVMYDFAPVVAQLSGR